MGGKVGNTDGYILGFTVDGRSVGCTEGCTVVGCVVVGRKDNEGCGVVGGDGR